MRKLFEERSDDIRRFCEIHGYSFEKVSRLSQSWNKTSVLFGYHDPEKGKAGLLDDTPMPLVLAVFKRHDGTLLFGLTEHTSKYFAEDLPIFNKISSDDHDQNEILSYDIELNNRRQELLNALPEFDSKITVPKDTTDLSDISALTAKTGDEFAIFSKNNESLIIRGNDHSINVDFEKAVNLAAQGYKLTGISRPETEPNYLQATSGDYGLLSAFNQNSGVIRGLMDDDFTFYINFANELFIEYSKKIRRFCNRSGLDFNKISKLSSCGNNDTLFLQSVDLNNKSGLLDEFPAPLILSIINCQSRDPLFGLTDFTKEYLNNYKNFPEN